MLSLDCTGYTGTFAGSGEHQLNIYGSVKFVSGMTFSSFAPILSMRASSGTVTIESGGKIISRVVFLFAATYRLVDKMRISLSSTSASPLLRYNTSAVFDANGQEVELTGAINYFSTDYAFTGTSAFYKLTKTGTAATNNMLSLDKNIEVTDTFTVNGNSAINRILVQSDTLGTQRTITAANVTITNADFRDIKGAGAGS
jgi:hypothetical protein